MVQKTCVDASWSNCDARTFEVRVGPNYVPGQKQPSDKALYSVFACDGFKMPSKINHIARFMDIKPYIEKYKTPYDPKVWGLPPIIIINVMTPNYPPEMTTGKSNGDGYQLVFYARLSDEVREILNNFNDGKLEQLPASIQLFNDFIHSTLDSPLRQRFKCIARIMNLNYAGFSFLTKNLVAQYNGKKKKKNINCIVLFCHSHTNEHIQYTNKGKPFLARTSSTFYHEPGKYFAADIDAHLFGFPARKGLSYIKDTINSMIYDVGFVIEGHTDEELPEQILCCARVSRIGVDQAVSFPSDFVEIASNKDHSKSYSDLHNAHLLQETNEKESNENKEDQLATPKLIDASDRMDKASMSVFSDTNDEEAQKIIEKISLEENKTKQSGQNSKDEKKDEKDSGVDKKEQTNHDRDDGSDDEQDNSNQDNNNNTTQNNNQNYYQIFLTAFCVSLPLCDFWCCKILPSLVEFVLLHLRSNKQTKNSKTEQKQKTATKI
ncbi:hypothetical protein RFI_23983 [Reticulomyxa filosa]|uniref:Protein ENHANCED DISEASE RESISTANCE 2 C-terminal domain-containing protein n=1 Tax=Reticulomyxa filosa TaxID=46433 RepID=X6MHR9_RETFI|nr:hypothetical protein RFI_23983 [Reticulomyxa filosa]|eukprot:ETO13394.1 hypothetical protein RFI_23983 [Reticulomyxa filosa]